MSHILRRSLILACATALTPLAPAAAQSIPSPIDFVIGANPGGGFDTYGRLIAQHLPDYLEGAPEIVVQNMPGAGSALAAEFIANTAESDGSVLGAIYPGAIVGPILTENFDERYDPQELAYIATANVSSRVCATYGPDAPQTVEEMTTGPVILGADAPGGSPYDYGFLFQNTVNPEAQVIPGYPGTRDIFAAMERGEVDGMCGIDFSSLRSISGSAIEDGLLHIVIQYAAIEDPVLDEMGATPFADLVSDADREAVELIIDQQIFGRPYVVSPDTPDDIVELLRAAFVEVFEDPDFLAQAEQAQLDLRWAGGAELQDTVDSMFATDPEVVAHAQALLSAE